MNQIPKQIITGNICPCYPEGKGNYFISHKNLELMIITDTVLINKDKVSVRLHWFKKSFTNSGAFSKSQGSSQFVFKKSAQGLNFLYLRGDNPFY